MINIIIRMVIIISSSRTVQSIAITHQVERR